MQLLCKLIKNNISCEINHFYVSLNCANFGCIKFEVHYLHRAAKLISADPAPFVASLYSFKL
jgi:hypothetical protein